ncbi:MAG: Tfp pilus assembly protein FimT/FimU, partial [Phycisphaerales bacterium]
MTRARGFTLIEVLVVAVMIAVIAGLAIDLSGTGAYERMDAASRFLDADLALARGRAMATPADPVVFRPATDGGGYWVARADPAVAHVHGVAVEDLQAAVRAELDRRSLPVEAGERQVRV